MHTFANGSNNSVFLLHLLTTLLHVVPIPALKQLVGSTSGYAEAGRVPVQEATCRRSMMLEHEVYTYSSLTKLDLTRVNESLAL